MFSIMEAGSSGEIVTTAPPREREGHASSRPVAESHSVWEDLGLREALTRIVNPRLYFLAEAHRDPLSTFGRYHEFKDKKWALEVLEVAANTSPLAALHYAHLFLQADWADNLIVQAAKKEPLAAMVSLHNLNNNVPLQQKVIGIVRDNPSTAHLAELFVNEKGPSVLSPRG
jgi:hypothetical protein